MLNKFENRPFSSEKGQQLWETDESNFGTVNSLVSGLPWELKKSVR